MKIKIALAFVFLFLSVPAGAETYQECIERRNQQRIQAMALEAPYIEIKCVKPPEEPKIEWLGKIIYLEEGERRKIQTMPPPTDGLEEIVKNITFKDDIEIGLREDGTVCWRKKSVKEKR